MDEATLQGLAETTTPGIWLEDFLEAIANPLPQLASRFDIQVTSQDDNRLPRRYKEDTSNLPKAPRYRRRPSLQRNLSYLRPRQPRRSDERPTK